MSEQLEQENRMQKIEEQLKEIKTSLKYIETLAEENKVKIDMVDKRCHDVEFNTLGLLKEFVAFIEKETDKM